MAVRYDDFVIVEAGRAIVVPLGSGRAGYPTLRVMTLAEIAPGPTSAGRRTGTKQP